MPAAFGLDISDVSLKVAKLEKKGKFFDLVSFGEFPIKPGLLEQGEIKNLDALAGIIKNALSNVQGKKLKTKYVIASLPEEKAFLTVIRMPLMEEEELASAVRYEAENHVPLPIESVYLGFQVVEPFHNHLDHLNVLIIALPKKIVDSYVKLLQKAELKPVVLEIESQATTRSLIKNQVSPRPVLILDLGTARTNFVIFSGYASRFTSSIPVCGKIFTRAIVRGMKVSSDVAEKIKIKYGLGRKGKIEIEGKNAKKIVVQEKLFELLNPALTDLIEQIKKHIDFYQTHTTYDHLFPNGKDIEKVLLCGGGARMKGICGFLSQELKIPTEPGNPWINILPQSLKEVPPISFEESLKYTTALGLALRGIKPLK